MWKPLALVALSFALQGAFILHAVVQGPSGAPVPAKAISAGALAGVP
jgi:phosphoribosylcarboxyaminoimidazole (NCAIR) mutase